MVVDGGGDCRDGWGEEGVGGSWEDAALPGLLRHPCRSSEA